MIEIEQVKILHFWGCENSECTYFGWEFRLGKGWLHETLVCQVLQGEVIPLPEETIRKRCAGDAEQSKTWRRIVTQHI